MRVVTERWSDRPTELGGPWAPHEPAPAAPTPGSRRLAAAAAFSGLVLFSLSLALSTRTGMWLDEAQTLSFAQLPLHDLLNALRTEGSPPLYYVLLHGWTVLFGTSEVVARSLSAVFAVAAVTLAPLAGAKLGARRTALATAFLLGTSPFMHRYATEARMYSLVVLLTVAGFLAVHKALQRPSRPALAAVAGVTGLLLLTHYWAFFLLATVAVVLIGRARRPIGGLPARRVLAAMALGSTAFLPWVPTFLFQVRHTGAPWGDAPGVEIVEAALRGFVGGRGEVTLLGFVYLALFAVGLLGRPITKNRIVLDPVGQPQARPLAFVVAATLGLGLVVLKLGGEAFAPRYAAVVLLPFLLVVARGLTVIQDRRALIVLVSVLGSLGLLRSVDEASGTRTQARTISSSIAARAQPTDLVAFCPDQLSPAVVRLLPGVTAETFPPGNPTGRVNWVDYLDRVRDSSPRQFADSLHRRAGNSTVWLVWAPGYHGLSRSCESVFNRLRQLRPAVRAQAQNYTAYEHSALWRFPSGPPN